MSEPPLTPTRLHRLRVLFDAAVELPEEEREAYLVSACPDDPTLKQEVQELLAAIARSGDTWDHRAGAAVAGAMADGLGVPRGPHQGERHAVGGRIGVYEITRLIGMGGMGAVYEGVRVDDQFRKRVALKFLRRGGEGDLAIRRFRYERQILANLNHRNIAALMDGGMTDDGQPYIVMEYVEGNRSRPTPTRSASTCAHASRCCGRCVRPCSTHTRILWCTAISSRAISSSRQMAV